jgi:hypothetical protein
VNTGSKHLLLYIFSNAVKDLSIVIKNICTLFVVVIVLLANARLAAQSPAWAWAHVWAGNSYNVGNCVTTDAAGNVYVGGEFFSSSIKSPGAADTARNSGTRYDFFIARYTASGSLVWLKSFGSPAGDDKIQGIAADADGNIFITGNATGSTLILGEDTLTGSGTMVPSLPGSMHQAMYCGRGSRWLRLPQARLKPPP